MKPSAHEKRKVKFLISAKAGQPQQFPGQPTFAYTWWRAYMATSKQPIIEKFTRQW